MRTIVFSDVHGEPDIIAAVLEHSGFEPHADRLIFAGDARRASASARLPTPAPERPYDALAAPG